MFYSHEKTAKLVSATRKYCSVALKVFTPRAAEMLRDRLDLGLKKGDKINLSLTPAGDIQVLNQRGEICDSVYGTLPGAPGQACIYATSVEGKDFKIL